MLTLDVDPADLPSINGAFLDSEGFQVGLSDGESGNRYAGCDKNGLYLVAFGRKVDQFNVSKDM